MCARAIDGGVRIYQPDYFDRPVKVKRSLHKNKKITFLRSPPTFLST